MKNKWNLFWKDWSIQAKSSMQFCRNHWFGMSVICVMTAVSYTIWIITYINNGYAKLNAWVNQRINTFDIRYAFEKVKNQNEK